MSDGEFSCWIFLEDETHFAEAQWVDAETAVRLARDITLRPAAQVGIIAKVRITDGLDYTAFEWRYGEGVVFPPTNQPMKNER